jgi:hypothetical protein
MRVWRRNDPGFRVIAILFISLAVIILPLAGCGSDSQPTATPPPATVEPATSQPTETQQPTATAEPTNTSVSPPPECPEAGDGAALYVSEENGYCFLYPDQFAYSADWPSYQPGIVTLTAPQHDPAESTYFFIQVMYVGQAVEVEDAQSYADIWQAVHNRPGVVLSTEAVTVGGQPAVMIPDLRGGFVADDPYLDRTTFVVVGGQKYRIAMQHGIGWSRAFESEAQSTWEMVTGTLVFFPPAAVQETVTAEAVCPQSGDDTRLAVNQSSGFCYLYPADFEPSPDVTYGFTTGSVLDMVEGMEVRPVFVVGTSGVADNLTLDEVAAQYAEDYVMQETVIGGRPAVTYLDSSAVPGPLRTGHVLANGLVYTIWASPYDLDRYPEAVANLDRIWEMAAGSMAFFSPFR